MVFFVNGKKRKNEDWAWFYYNKGFSIIPVKKKSKKPNISTWERYQNIRPTKEEIQTWFDRGLFGNIGIICGAVSGNLVALDLDDKNIVSDLDLNLDATMKQGYWVVKTGGKGRYQIWSKHKENPGNTQKAIDVNMEYRADGGYVVAPPSIHPSGAEYHYLHNEKPEELPPFQEKDVKKIFEKFVKNLREKRGIKTTIAEKPQDMENVEADCIKNILKGGLTEGKRNETAFTLTNYYYKIKKMNSTEIKALVKDWNTRNKPSLPDTELQSVINSAVKTNKITGCNKISQLGFCPYEDKNECPFIIPEEKSKEELLKECSVFTYKDDKVDKIICPRLAELILNKHNYYFITMKETGQIYYYNGSYYESGGEQIIKNLVNYYLSDLTKEHYKHEVVGFIRDNKIVEKEDFNPPSRLINLKNGILNIETNDLRPHAPEYYFLYELKIDYDLDAGYEEFEQFLQQVCNNEVEVKTIQEYIGYMLYRDYLYKKFLILDGSGDNGKTTLMNMIINFIGPENNTSITLQDVAENRFACSKLFGKLANISDDLPKRAVKNTGVLKQITGGSQVWADIKFSKGGISFTNYAKPIYACNELPEASDDTHAFFSRMISITLKKQFLPKGSPEIDNKTVFEANPHLVRELSKPEKLSGMLNFALKGLQRLMENGRFTIHTSIQEIRDTYTIKTNPTRAYVKEDIEFANDWCITCDDFYHKVLDYCDQNNIDHPTKHKVTTKLNETNLKIEKRQRTINGERGIWCWVNMRSASDSLVNHYLGEKKEEQKQLV